MIAIATLGGNDSRNDYSIFCGLASMLMCLTVFANSKVAALGTELINFDFLAIFKALFDPSLILRW